MQKNPSPRRQRGQAERNTTQSVLLKAGRRRRGRSRLSAEAIVEAAIALADEQGLDAVSIRRVAAELEARPMSLYRHIASKDELLAAMSEAVKNEIFLPRPLPEDWREALASLARRQFAVFLAHPWAVPLFMRHSSFGASGTRLAQQMSDALAGLQLEATEMWLVAGTVSDYVIGYSLRAVSRPAAAGLADTVSASEVEEFPELDALQSTLRSRSASKRSSSERFEAGLQILLDGIEGRFAA